MYRLYFFQGQTEKRRRWDAAKPGQKEKKDECEAFSGSVGGHDACHAGNGCRLGHGPERQHGNSAGKSAGGQKTAGGRKRATHGWRIESPGNIRKAFGRHMFRGIPFAMLRQSNPQAV